MITIPKQFIASLPLIIIGFTVVILLISITCYRNNFFNASLALIGLALSLLSLYFVKQINEIDIMSLLSIDNYSIFYMSLIIISSLSTCIFSYIWLNNFIGYKEEFYILLLISTLGGLILSSANNFAVLLLGIELLSLPLFGLIGYDFYKKLSLEACIKYTILSIIASSFLLFGIALIYSKCGGLNFFIPSKKIPLNFIEEPLFLVGLIMIVVSTGFKLSLVPFHLWTPDVYQGAPTPISSFLSTVSKVSIFSAITRLFIYIPIINIVAIKNILIIMAFMSIIFGNLMAVFQKNIKRLLGYSSISHIGYLLISLVAIKEQKLSLETSGIYIISYIVSNLAIFGVIILISNIYKEIDFESVYSYRGLFRYNPFLTIVMTVMLLSLAGIPITLGFIGKMYVIILSIKSHLWWLIGAIIISSGIGIYYYLRIILSFYINTSTIINNNSIISNNNCTLTNNLILGKIILLISTTLILIMGIYPQPLINLIQLIHPMMYA
ncbi:NADH-quinone oxidoreductase subunit NuoN [Candidatus Pantoea edessiphila]|uniref:NADH-quinone oxidoreductase subunit N n=1 Tax=Candidatus Pantoea edessiphila TaxID=2044610 RepID=A0A2P5T2S3_9GAMM|nr:NADH-quinone oxidoreductase subunit NuoN [Candidatus Pantoea edessiphila]PPI88879.1 NADH-quinone oxidoreductase subunit NuoN [Candidatus Pantoea edessiphila]